MRVLSCPLSRIIECPCTFVVLFGILAKRGLEVIGDTDAELAHGRPSSLDPGLRSFRGGIPGLRAGGGTLGRADKAESNLSYLEGKDLWSSSARAVSGRSSWGR